MIIETWYVDTRTDRMNSACYLIVDWKEIEYSVPIGCKTNSSCKNRRFRHNESNFESEQ